MTDKLLPMIFLLVVVCNCPLTRQAAGDRPFRTEKADLVEEIKAVDCDDADRQKEVVRLFERNGAGKDEIKTEKFEDVSNVVVTVRGRTDETVVVGAHFDKTTLGCGAIDNWTGVVIVANLFENFRQLKNEKTYKFVAFGKEEKGLVGSKAMADAIPNRDINKHCAMVNFDSFGFTDIWTLETISDTELIDLARDVARKNGDDFEVKNFSGASSDSKSFLRVNIPAITLSGLGDDWRDYLHQEKDQVENVNMDKVYDNLEFAFRYLNEIDQSPCGRFR